MDSNALAAMAAQMQVKNTFLDFDSLDDLEFGAHISRRQVSEPASALTRQLSVLQEQAQQIQQVQQQAQQIQQAQQQIQKAQQVKALAQAQIGSFPTAEQDLVSAPTPQPRLRPPEQPRLLTGDDESPNPQSSGQWSAMPFFPPGAMPLEMGAMTAPFAGNVVMPAVPVGMMGGPNGPHGGLPQGLPLQYTFVPGMGPGNEMPLRMPEVYNASRDNGYHSSQQPMQKPVLQDSGGMGGKGMPVKDLRIPDAGSAAKGPSSGQIPADWQSVTTVMLRNLPNKYSQPMLLEELNQAGFAGGYDFMYLPIDPETHANRGYAFINFVSPDFAWLARRTYEGQKMGKFNSEKLVSVVPAALQGFEANYSHYSTARVNRGPAETRPVFLRESSMPKTKPERKRGGRRNQGSLIDMAARQLQKKEVSSPSSPQSKNQGYVGIPGPMVSKGEQDSQEQVRYCANCGGKAHMDFRFCQFCGTPLAQSEAVWGA